MAEMEKSSSSLATLVPSGSNKVSLFQRTLWLLNVLYYQILAILTIVLFWVFFEAYDLTQLRLWHLVWSTAAYIPLMAAAIILFSEDNIVTLYIPRTKRYTIHGALLFLSCVFITVGIAVETHRKRQAGATTHFVSDHAILGLVSWILIFVSVLIGVLTANTRIVSKYVRPIVVKCVHNFLGLAAFAIGIGSLYLMLSIVRRRTSENIFKATQIGVIYVTIWSGLAALKSLLLQIKGVFS